MMEGLKGLKVGNNEQQVVIVQDQLDMGDGMQCSDHPYTNNPGGICAFCLQDKLGKLVSSSFPPLRNSTTTAAVSSSSSSPSFRSDPTTNNANATTAAAAPSSLSLSLRPRGNDATSFHNDEFYTRRARMSFLLARKKKKKVISANSNNEDMVFKRSKSTTTPRRAHLMEASNADEFSSPRKRNGFWSFLYHQHKAAAASNSKKLDNKSSFRDSSKISSSSSFTSSAIRGGCGDVVHEEDDVSPNSSHNTACSFERKVSRSRSVGCGSRSFSGDFFERISTGFGDCTLRRVESQREGKTNKPTSVAVVRNGAERVKCGGLFSGFMMTSSSTTTSSSSSSSYWVSSVGSEEMNGGAGRSMTSVNGGRNGRGSWGWAFASPMRAFSRPSSKDGKIIMRKTSGSDKNTTPNLSAIPSLLSVR